MKSITIHGLEDDLDGKIRSKAKAEGLSLNKTIKMIMRSALGLDARPGGRREDFIDLFGIWEASELQAFSDVTNEEFGRIDVEDWK